MRITQKCALCRAMHPGPELHVIECAHGNVLVCEACWRAHRSAHSKMAVDWQECALCQSGDTYAANEMHFIERDGENVVVCNRCFKAHEAKAVECVSCGSFRTIKAHGDNYFCNHCETHFIPQLNTDKSETRKIEIPPMNPTGSVVATVLIALLMAGCASYYKGYYGGGTTNATEVQP